MKILKKTILVFVSVLIVLSIAAFLLPEEVHVERSKQINVPARIVFNQINDLQCWSNWVTWSQTDPDIKYSYTKGGVGVGAGASWTSENVQVGNGKLFITTSVPYDSIVINMDFLKGGEAFGVFRFSEDSSATLVSWSFVAHLGNNPAARWMGLMYGRMIGMDMEKGLINLQTKSLQIKEKREPIVEQVTLKEQVFAGIREKVKWENVGPEMSKMYQTINDFLLKKKIGISDMPFAIYHSMNEGELDLECGIPVVNAFESTGEVNCGKRWAGKYAFATHVGSYETLETTHSAIQKWITQHSFSVSGGPIEVYLTNPEAEPDPEKWVTNIYYPLK